MKGLTATLSVLLIFSILLSLATTISSKNLEFKETLYKNFVADRVFAKYDNIEFDLLRIMKEVLGITVAVNESSSNIVIFQETLPHLDSNVYAYQQGLDNLTYFVNNYMNESNLNTILKPDDIRDNLLLMIRPYDINYTHAITSEIGKTGGEGGSTGRILDIIPKDTSQLTKYKIILVLNGEIKNTQWEQSCSPGTLTWEIITIGTNRQDTQTKNINPADTTCTYRINTIDDETKGWIRIHNAYRTSYPGSLTIRYHINNFDSPLIFNSTISLSLADVPEKVKITLLPDIIKVNEVLYNIGRNDTAYIY